MRTKNTTFEIQNPKVIHWEHRGVNYVWSLDDANMEGGICRVSHIHTDEAGYGEDKWFLFAVADCFDPVLHAVLADTFERAYDEFLCQAEEELTVENTEVTDDTYFNENGKPVDTESVQGFEVTLKTIKF